MRIIVRGHPVARMHERGITRVDIETALRNHHSRWATPKGGIQYEGVAPDGRTLKVWLLPPGYVDEHTTITVKSVAWKD